jgi:hypothetical protein
LSGDSKGQVWIFLNTGDGGTPRLAAGTLLVVDGKPLKGAQLTIGKEFDDPKKIKGRFTVRRGKDGKTKYMELKRIGFSHEKAEQYTRLHAADWDGDGRIDLLVGDYNGACLLYRNEGKREAVFGLPTEIRPEKSDEKETTTSSTSFAGGRPSPYLYDWDGDGKRDLLVGTEKGQVWFYRNEGKDHAPRFGKGTPLRAGGKEIKTGYRARIGVCDWNGDGVPDLLVGNCYSSTIPGIRRETRGNVWLYVGKRTEDEGEF